MTETGKAKEEDEGKKFASSIPDKAFLYPSLFKKQTGEGMMPSPVRDL